MSEGIRVVQRALQVLRVMNARTVWSLQELHVETGLAKSTLHRLLGTLELEGYVRSESATPGRYGLTPSVRDLSCGVTEQSRLVQAAKPLMVAATRDMRWPLSLGVLDRASVDPMIRVAFCTMPYSPYAIRPSSEGRRYDLTSSALGKAYLSFCSPRERRILVETLNARRTEDGDSALDVAGLGPSWRQVRRQGYAIRYARDRSQSTAVAVPVFVGRELQAALVYSTFAGMINPSMLASHLAVATRTAERIGEAAADRP